MMIPIHTIIEKLQCMVKAQFPRTLPTENS